MIDKIIDNLYVSDANSVISQRGQVELKKLQVSFPHFSFFNLSIHEQNSVFEGELFFPRISSPLLSHFLYVSH